MKTILITLLFLTLVLSGCLEEEQTSKKGPIIDGNVNLGLSKFINEGNIKMVAGNGNFTMDSNIYIPSEPILVVSGELMGEHKGYFYVSNKYCKISVCPKSTNLTRFQKEPICYYCEEQKGVSE